MLLNQILDPEDVYAAVEAGYVRKGQHNTLPLSVYCYTEQAVFERCWTPTTRRMRGLVVENGTTKIIAWCMSKFFSLGEHLGDAPYAGPLPKNEPFRIFSKLDGSMITVFHYNGRWMAASKGSFHSPQADWANEWLADRDLSWLHKDTTYVTELVHPENRIVVDYGDRKSLVLLTTYDSRGEECNVDHHADTWRRIGGQVAGEWILADVA